MFSSKLKLSADSMTLEFPLVQLNTAPLVAKGLVFLKAECPGSISSDVY